MAPAKPLPIEVPDTSTYWPFDEMVGGDLRAHLDQIVRAHAELGELALGLDIGHGEMPARGAA